VSEIKFCKDCKYSAGEFISEGSYCGYPIYRSKVTGKLDTLCLSARQNNWIDKKFQCGTEAKYFEPKDKK
jgi:hypothetical protein